jgi:hypothetical protein
VITTLSDEEVQGELLMVHLNIFAPEDKPLTSVAGLFAFEKVPVPDTTLHVPVPDVGLFAPKVV